MTHVNNKNKKRFSIIQVISLLDRRQIIFKKKKEEKRKKKKNSPVGTENYLGYLYGELGQADK